MIGKMLGNRYELIEKIGEGGMGLVYKAKCHLLNRYVAVKILKPELTEDEEFVNKFRKESLSSASLSHPNIVNIYDVGVEDGIYYIVMEYVKGKTLKEIIKERAPMPYNDVINISRQICCALEHAHDNNIIHRDIKPQNIMVTQDGIVKVADFGIARASNSATLTNTGNVIGSVYYISPEQARGGYTDEKTDIYSLGTVMYEMATGSVPFSAESPVVVALKHIQENVVRPSELNPEIPSALEDIILKSLEKIPSSRYESAGALIRDLDKASSSPNTRMAKKQEGLNDITRVMPAINEDYTSKATQKNVDKKKRVNKGWIAAVVVLFTIVTVAMLLTYGKLSMNSNKEVAIPADIIGKDKSVAEAMLKQYGIGMQPEEQYNAEYPAGVVISTVPEVGTHVKPGFSVKVKISMGPAKINVPNVIGDTLTDAKFKIEGAHLKSNVIEMNHETMEKDRVFKVAPDVNSEVSEGTVIDIYVSEGPEVKLVEVPLLEGVTLDKIPDRLKEKNLIVGDIDVARDTTKPDNVVIFQRIPQGTMVNKGTAIDITVNKISLPSTP